MFSPPLPPTSKKLSTPLVHVSTWQCMHLWLVAHYVYSRGQRTPASSKECEQKMEKNVGIETHAVRLFSFPVHCRPVSWISPMPMPNAVPLIGMGTETIKHNKLYMWNCNLRHRVTSRLPWLENEQFWLTIPPSAVKLSWRQTTCASSWPHVVSSQTVVNLLLTQTSTLPAYGVSPPSRRSSPLVQEKPAATDWVE